MTPAIGKAKFKTPTESIMTKIEMTVGLDEESKKLLNAAIKAAATIAGAAAGGKATKTTKTAKAEEPADEDFDDMGDGEDGDGEEDADEGDGEDGDTDDGDGDGEDGADEVTVDTVGEALKAYATAPGGSKALAVKLLKAKGGTEKLSVLKKAKFEAVIAAAKAATVALKKKAKAAK
jgi:hypothetical protein